MEKLKAKLKAKLKHLAFPKPSISRTTAFAVSKNTVTDRNPSDEDTIRAKRLLYVETLLRNHLKFISYPIPERPEYEYTPDERRELLRRAAEILEENADEIAAFLLTAAAHVADTTDDRDEAAVMDEFLQSAVGSFNWIDYEKGSESIYVQTAVGSFWIDYEKGSEFIYAAFGELMQIETELELEYGGNQADLSGEEPTSPGSPLSVLIGDGDESITVPFDQVLPFFWTPDGRLATDCHACTLPFVEGDPPIRTINIAMGDSRTLQVRVFNTHFPCIKDNRIPFVPVSHVWTDSIRQANVDQTHNDAAATKLIRTLMGLGRGAEGAYDPEVEFWHDYFSVPQWQAEVREQLLVRLPAIYHLPDEILVHLEDVPYVAMWTLLLNPYPETLLFNPYTQTADNDPFLKVMTVLPHIRALFGSEWMRRMWVTLEYAQCRAACVMMTKEGRIHRLLDHDDQTQTDGGHHARDTFSHALTIAHNYFNDTLLYARSFVINIGELPEFAAGLGWKSRLFEGHPPFLGESIELVASKQCQYPRDRFIALDVLLDGRRTEGLPAGEAVLPAPEAKACEHVWLKALRQGDWSPLLLQPRERISESNPSTQSGLASWLVGHSCLEGVEWDFAEQITAPDFVPVITDEGVILGTLVLVGEIEEICYLDVEEATDMGGVAFALHHIFGLAKAEGMELSPELLGDGLQRIFPCPDRSGDNLGQIDRLFTIAHADRRDPEVADKIRCFLAEYDGSIGDGSIAAQVAQGISDVLGLEVGVSGAGKVGKAFTRLWRSKSDALRREERGAKGGDPICKVRCPECRRVTPFRLDLRETGGVGQKVYRIPGLTYSSSIKDGVGLVIDGDGRITGRMQYGPPACDCRLLVEVEIH